jgi:hypothetical protein
LAMPVFIFSWKPRSIVIFQCLIFMIFAIIYRICIYLIKFISCLLNIKFLTFIHLLTLIFFINMKNDDLIPGMGIGWKIDQKAPKQRLIEVFNWNRRHRQTWLAVEFWNCLSLLTVLN